MIKLYKSFLPHDHAWDLACSIDATPAHWWFKALRYKDRKTPEYCNNNVGGYRQQFIAENSLAKSVTDGFYSYKWTRSTPHVKNCKCYECTFKKDVLESEGFKSFLKQETHLKNPVLNEYFTSIYYPGDFLGQHHDQGKGIAFIFNLSWKWRPEYGGLLHVENELGFQAYNPGWWDLVLLSLAEGNGENHFVSEVTKYAPRPRLAISGWFNEGEE